MGVGQASLEWQETGFRKCKCSFPSRPAVEPELVEYRIKRKGGTREEERRKRSRRRGGRGAGEEKEEEEGSRKLAQSLGKAKGRLWLST